MYWLFLRLGKEVSNSALEGTAYVEDILGVYFEDDEGSSSAWEGGWGLLTVARVNKDSYSILSTDIITEGKFGVDIEGYEVSVKDWYNGWVFSTVDIINTYSSSVVSTNIVTDYVLEYKSMMGLWLGVITPPTSACLWASWYSSY